MVSTKIQGHVLSDQKKPPASQNCHNEGWRQSWFSPETKYPDVQIENWKSSPESRDAHTTLDAKVRNAQNASMHKLTDTSQACAPRAAGLITISAGAHLNNWIDLAPATALLRFTTAISDDPERNIEE